MSEYRLPYRLSFVPGSKGKLKPGRGEAGWTVVTLPSAKAVLDFMDDFPQAEMPAWKRIRKEGPEVCRHK